MGNKEKAIEIDKEVTLERKVKEVTGKRNIVITVFGVLTALFAIYYITGAHIFLGTIILTVAYRGALMALLFFMLLLVYKWRKNIELLSAVALIMGMLGCGYFFFFYVHLQDTLATGTYTILDQVMFIFTLVGVLEATRKTIGLTLAIIAIVFLIFPFVDNYLPGILHGRGYSFERVLTVTYTSPDGIFGTPVGVAATIIIMFVIFGQFLQATKGGKFFVDLALALLGSVRGGPAQVAVLASGLFGMISGSPISNVMTTGAITIPLMKKMGYSAEFSGGLSAVASTGGVIMPPVMGSVVFVMAANLGLPYWEVCVAAALPAILYYLALFFMVDFEAARKNMHGIPRKELPSLKETIKDGWYSVIPLIALILLMFVLLYTPERSALWATVIMVLIASVRKGTRLSPRAIALNLKDSVMGLVPVAMACAASGIIIASLSLTGLGVKLAGGLVELSGGNLVALLVLAAIASLILGMGLPSIPCYLLVAVMAAPSLLKMGVAALPAHFFVLYFGIASFITLPVAPAVFAAVSLTKGKMWPTGYHAVRLGIVTFIVPFLFIYRPSMLFIGSPQDIAVTVIVSVIGIGVLAAGLAGYFLTRLSWWKRVILVADALFLLAPGTWTDITGLVIAAVFVLSEIWLWRRTKIAAVTPGDDN